MSKCNRGSGYKSGMAHHRCKYPAEIVEQARALNDQGKGYKTIAKALGITSWNTVRDWCAYRTRGVA